MLCVKSGVDNNRAIDVCVSRWSQHLEARTRRAEIIRTVRSEGYMHCAEVTRSPA